MTWFGLCGRNEANPAATIMIEGDRQQAAIGGTSLLEEPNGRGLRGTRIAVRDE